MLADVGSERPGLRRLELAHPSPPRNPGSQPDGEPMNRRSTVTKYQLELLSPLGVWTPCGPPARSMTAAYLFGLRIYPNHDLRVMPVVTDETED